MTVSAPGVLRNSAVVAVASTVSRITGLVRVWAMWRAIGVTNRLADAYNVSNNVPNIIYELLIGGVLTAALVPLFVQRTEEDDRDGLSAVISVAVLCLAALTTAAIIAAPAIARLLSVGITDTDPEAYLEVLTRLVRWFVPQIYFYGLVTVATALANARGRFFLAAVAPAVANIVIVANFLLLPAVATEPLPGEPIPAGYDPIAAALADPVIITMLGLGTTLGVAASALVLVPTFSPRDLRLRFLPRFRHPAVLWLVRASGWTVAYVATNQVTAAVVIVTANRLPPGAIAAFNSAYIFFIVPHGLLAVSFMTVLLPDLARTFTRGDRRALRETWTRGLRWTALVIFPAGFGLAVVAQPLIDTLALQFDDVQLTAQMLAAFAVGLPGFSLYLYALRAFYAEGDVRTPFMLNLGENAIQIVLTVAFAALLGAPGLGLAQSVAYAVAAVWAFAVAAKRVGRVPVRQVAALPGIAFAALAAAVLAAAVLALARWLGPDLPALVELVLGIAVAAAAYPPYLRAFGAAADLEPIIRRLRGVRSRVQAG